MKFTIISGDDNFSSITAGDEQLLAVSRVQDCANDINKWMKQSKLKLNDDKTEFMIMSSKRQQRHVSSGSMIIGDSVIECTDCGKSGTKSWVLVQVQEET